MAKEPWRQLITSLSPVRKLSPEWMEAEPELKDFDLEGKDLNTIYRERKRLEDNKQTRINKLEKTRPENPGKTKAPLPASLFIVAGLAAVCYTILADPRDWRILVGLILASLLGLGLVWLKVDRVEKAYRKEDMAVSDQIHAVKNETYEFEEDYQKLKGYAEALADHQAWQRRRDPEFWRKAGMDDVINNLVSMYRTSGINAAASNEPYISLVYENSNGKDCGFYLNTKEPLTIRMVNKYLESAYMEGCKPGVIVCYKGIQKDAAQKCEEEIIQVWTVEDIVEFAKEIEDEFE